jgi:hypothetical protein
MATKDTESGFLSRWSRRKLEAGAEPAPEAEEGAGKNLAGDEAAPPAAATDAPAEARREGKRAEETPPELTGADVEKLGPDADYSIFMKKGVAPHVQRLALRKLWRSDPIYSYHDGLTDYADDYRGEAAASMGKVASVWKPGRGLLKGEEGAGVDDAPVEAPEDLVEAAGEAEEGEGKGAPKPSPDDGDDAEKA